MIVRFGFFTFLVLLTFLGTGCTISKRKAKADLTRIYNPAAQNHGEDVNPVILIPGILGSKLTDPITGKSIWGIYDNHFLSPQNPENLPLLALPLHGEKKAPRGVPNGALSRLKFRALGVPLQQRAYAGILTTLGAGGYLDADVSDPNIDWGKKHFTCFQFSYDWRLSNAENAKKLHQFILEKRRYIQKRSREIYGRERKNLKFDIVAHSMGGLLARYYLRYGTQSLPSNGSLPRLNWHGAKHIEQLIMVGTPNSGSILAFNDLLDGQNLIPLWQRYLLAVNLPKFPPAVLATYPSLFELLPRTRHQPLLNLRNNQAVDLFDPAVWENSQWGLLHPSQDKILAQLLPEITTQRERQAIATQHLRQRLLQARQFHQALDLPATPPGNLRISLIAGDSISTPRQQKIDLNSGKRTDNDYTPGDGTVLRSSTLADERVGNQNLAHLRIQSPIKFHRVTFLPEEHLELTTSVIFTNNLLYQLLLEPRISRN